jgi:hypothetical protein
VADYLLGLESANDAQRTRGRAWLLAAADAGHRDALRRVVAAYRTGADGIARDLEQARWYGEQWLAALQAAGVQHNQAPWMRASWDYADTLRQLRRERERYLPPDELERAVRAGDAEARYHRARELMREDFAAGVALLEQAADGGFAEAQYHAARRVRARKSPPDALRRALDWLRSAAQSGHRGALYELGTVYAQGVHEIGLAPDPAQARSLFERALDGGGEELYRYADAGGRGWIVTAHQVRRWLERLPK